MRKVSGCIALQFLVFLLTSLFILPSYGEDTFTCKNGWCSSKKDPIEVLLPMVHYPALDINVVRTGVEYAKHIHDEHGSGFLTAYKHIVEHPICHIMLIAQRTWCEQEMVNDLVEHGLLTSDLHVTEDLRMIFRSYRVTRFEDKPMVLLNAKNMKSVSLQDN